MRLCYGEGAWPHFSFWDTNTVMIDSCLPSILKIQSTQHRDVPHIPGCPSTILGGSLVPVKSPSRSLGIARSLLSWYAEPFRLS